MCSLETTTDNPQVTLSSEHPVTLAIRRGALFSCILEEIRDFRILMELHIEFTPLNN